MMLKQFEASGQIGSGALQHELSDPKTWIAYTVTVVPDALTSIPIPTIYDKYHTTHLFLIHDTPQDNLREPAIGLVNTAQSTAHAQQASPRSISALFEAEIEPKSPHGTSNETDLKVELFYDSKHVCWFARG
jgi:hypothetical protein